MNPLMKDIRHYFGFLFDKGYKIRESNIPFWSNRGWSVVFESAECLIEIYYDSGEVFLVFSPTNVVFNNHIDIRAMIYYLSNGKNIIRRHDYAFYKDRKKQLDWMSYLLRTYIDEISPCFINREFGLHKNEILAASKEYSLIYWRRLG
jgi:hypothetical protein